MITAAIVIDGVLRKPVGGQLVTEGRRLYVALASTGRVVLLGDASEQTADWLELNGCVSHDFVYVPAPHQVALAGQANQLRRDGYAVDMVIVADPVEAAELVEAGFNTLLFTHAEYAIPAWRPDAPTGVRPWHDVVAAAKEQAKMKAADARLRNEE